MRNIYFELTEEFNAQGTIAILTSGQAVVFYRIAIMSKDGDWILRETPQACARILEVLAARGAHYRTGAPLDVRWLSGGWSSHLEFQDEKQRRVRCDFISRPPRVPRETVERAFTPPETEKLKVLDLPSLIRMKQTQRAKDYAVIGELARLLPEDEEIELTTDPDRILALASRHGKKSTRSAVEAALRGAGREDVVIALAQEINALQEEDRKRLEKYEEASRKYFGEFRGQGISDLPLLEAHREAVALALRLLPEDPNGSRGKGPP